MPRVQFSNLAENDLEDISDFIALDSCDAAVAFIHRLRNTCHELADHPDMGVQRSHFKGSNLRFFSVGQYLIFYRKILNGVEIALVLHGARDLDALLG
jgi:toxin ParE1/3/4